MMIKGVVRLWPVSYTHLDVYKRQLYNPYVKTVDGELSIEPANGADYVDRSKDFSHKIDHDDLCLSLIHI